MQRVALSPSRSRLALLASSPSVLVLLILSLLLSLFFSVCRVSVVSSGLSFLLSCVRPASAPSCGQDSDDAPLSCVPGDTGRSSSSSSVLASLPAFCFAAAILLFLSRLATWTYKRVSLKKRREPRGRLQRTPSEERGTKKTQTKDANAPLVTVVVLGSGGHTGEMLRLVQSFNPRFFRIHFLVTDSDSTSLQQLAAAHWRSFQDAKTVETKELDEETKKAQEAVQGELAEAELTALVRQRGFCFHRFPRSREVGQSVISSFFSSVRALLASLRLVWRLNPQLVLVNGPGSCVPVAVAALLREFLLGRRIRLIYVESVCRVDSLSLSGRLLYPFADRFLVQWPGLAEKFPKSEYVGRFF
ncbi:putative glycosyl transferase [Toxoplasma gondii VEG]|uniref:UDP-N-acetylglucosamine transferase subunit ALG14 n=1 Tax=Toxoplasma gondii (strain ATCC 50861 / VEG) TaxID=432359 RepID=V4YIQ8_TOXGV|nr:putative glycosyl transferase [Toxoplasma gondii VEG]CEL77168.1 TPA: glycosyl transferase, putative [Toxoplasma gondii VEG]